MIAPAPDGVEPKAAVYSESTYAPPTPDDEMDVEEVVVDEVVM